VRHSVREPTTLGACLAHLFAEASGRTRKQMLAGGRVRVNGVVTRLPTTALAAGDVVEVGAKQSRGGLPAGLTLVHEDRDVLVVDKPAGLLTIATERERRRTAYAHLTAHLQARRPPGRAFIVHRLDRLASGLLVFAASPAAKRALQAQFHAHGTERTYLAVVEGAPTRAEGTIRSRLVDDEPGRVRETRDPERGRPAVTHWRVVKRGVRHALLEVRLETGRRNQIRVHLSAMGHPIAGDRVYGATSDPFGRLALHAHVLGFDHPHTGDRMRFVSAAPAAFSRLGALHLAAPNSR
jgi:23S rRNA pseudouridine1911/1915/1917 synthase